MRFYDQQHEFYCGVDLHTRRMYQCILDREGTKRLHRNVRAKPLDFLRAIKGFREDLVVGAECVFRDGFLATAFFFAAFSRGAPVFVTRSRSCRAAAFFDKGWRGAAPDARQRRSCCLACELSVS